MQGFHNLFHKSKRQKTVNQGLMPDILIQYSTEDIIQERDLHKVKVEELIQENSK